MKVAWLCQTTGVHESRFIRAFKHLGHSVVCLQWSLAKDNPSSLANCFDGIGPDIVIGGPLHIGAEYFEIIEDLPFVALSYAYDILLEAGTSQHADFSVRSALERCCGLVVDCQAVLDTASNMMGGRLPPHIVRPWGLEQNSMPPHENLDNVNFIFQRLRNNSVKRVIICTRGWNSIHGTMHVLDAFLELREHIDDIGLVLAGDGPLRNAFEERIARAHAEKSVVLAGKLTETEVSECLTRSDLFVGASAIDGSSVSLLQALNASLPVVVPHVGGNPEWAAIADGVMTFNPVTASTLANVIAAALERSVGKSFNRSKILAEKCDWRRNSEDIASFCQILIGR